MCGILIVHSKTNKLDLNSCNSALKRLSLRGPDYDFSNIYFDGSLFFGQTVLSITGKPGNHLKTYHLSENNRYDIVLNGEIYNHKELHKKYLLKENLRSVTNCDTETLVNLHQVFSPIDIYKMLKGMFAYAVYDKISESIIIGRDIIGEKILYRYEDDNYFILSSEIGPILELVPSIKINKEILKEYFFTRHLLAPTSTTFQNIELIQPGHLIEYDLKSKKSKTLYQLKPADLIDPSLIEANKSKNSEELADELESVFVKTAKLLSPSIDYYAVFSGGIDSSLVSYFMQQHNPPKGFISLQFPGKDKTNLDMTGFEKKIGRKINTLKVDKDMFSKFFPECYKAACGPLSTHSFVSQAIMSSYVKNDNVKVLIGGDGADELFGGYEFYQTFDNNIKSYPEVNPSAYSGFVALDAEFENWNTENLQNNIKDRWLEHSQYYSFEKDPYERMLQTVLYSDTVIQLESVGIRAADTMSMVNSVESRSFFLSYDIIKFALNLPAKHKIELRSAESIMTTKPLLKKLYVQKYGKELLFEKQGFSGYPNEAAQTILNNQYPNLYNELNFKMKKDYENNIALKWKMMNVELFMNTFNGYY